MGAGGRRLGQLSSVFAPALVALYAAYTYALGEVAYFLVEEPEAHAHPVLTHFLGRYLRRLVERLGGRFNVVAATHSLDFVKGLKGGPTSSEEKEKE
ncbi:ATP-binding protein [Thermoproteus tenax]|uniref:Predicted ATPase n=1 Tax=Thermoproteus tenax (strain ATCC 35583 / DSM 2078 / JCM 9277 / NBRC 100435 / Kra 1) TaxID=768679 RepID=G4RJX9_THETK|nr:ATP-binding protein [Thermoproteus tenax]CCC81874.1 Predicted ATPase [Thermoproteus tenax Kra 1]